MNLFMNDHSILESQIIAPNPAGILGPLTKGTLGNGLGIFILIVVSLEAVTTGDTALRSSRLILADFFKIDQRKMSKRILVAAPLFAITIGLLFFSLFRSEGFGVL
jgi:carbon starvation protein CstA